KGLEPLLTTRAARGEGDKKVREAYSRCAKSLIRVATSEKPGADRLLGFTLELIAETDVTVMKPGAEATFRLLYEGKPLANALVSAARKGAGDDRKLSARTDANGRVGFKLDDSGMWQIASVHMIRAADDRDYQWESFWASLTFETAHQPQ